MLNHSAQLCFCRQSFLNNKLFTIVNFLSDLLEMRSLLSWLSSKWSNYKYRFTPWIALNLDRETVRLDFDLAKPQELVHHLQGMLEVLEQYSALRDDLALYDGLHQSNQVGYSLRDQA